jgi:predicted nucleotidyltransferase component of viral defense system
VPEAFVQLPPDEQASILQTCAGKLGRRPEHLEKDVWICWVLQALFTMPDRLPMAFKGGTSLSKVYGAIRRFSEDVDVTVD